MPDEHEAAIKGARAALDGFMRAFNRQDAEAIRTRWFHFPHVRLHSGTVTGMATPSDYHNLVWSRTGQSAGWTRTAWDYQEVVDAGLGRANPWPATYFRPEIAATTASQTWHAAASSMSGWIGSARIRSARSSETGKSAPSW
jgi:hypothetical protein